MTTVDKSGEIYTIHVAALLERPSLQLRCLTLERDITSGVCVCLNVDAAPCTQRISGLALGT